MRKPQPSPNLFPMAALLAAAAVCGAFAAAGTAHAAAGPQTKAARAAIDAGRYAEAVKTLTPLVSPEKGGKPDPEALYLLGVAGFRLVDQEIAAERQKGAQQMDVLTPSQAEQLKESLARFRKAEELAPKAEFAPEAAFLAARIQDFGYLQRFAEAPEAFRRVVRQYPGTDAARRAQERVSYWENLFRHGELKNPAGAPHAPTVH